MTTLTAHMTTLRDHMIIQRNHMMAKHGRSHTLMLVTMVTVKIALDHQSSVTTLMQYLMKLTNLHTPVNSMPVLPWGCMTHWEHYPTSLMRTLWCVVIKI